MRPYKDNRYATEEKENADLGKRHHRKTSGVGARNTRDATAGADTSCGIVLTQTPAPGGPLRQKAAS